MCDPQKRRSRIDGQNRRNSFRCQRTSVSGFTTLGHCAFYLFIRQPHGSEVSPAARNTLDSARIPRASKLLICGLFLKGRVLAQDGKAKLPEHSRSVSRPFETSSWRRRFLCGRGSRFSCSVGRATRSLPHLYHCPQPRSNT